ncbi:MAG: LDL receptor domain-containing protein [Myxococcota bacterium]
MRKIIFLLPLIFVFSGCDDDKSSMEKLFSKLNSCDLLTEGEMPDGSEPSTSYDKCTVNCVIKTDCDSLYTLYCEEETPESLELCADDCFNKYAFECGDGSLIQPDFECDGYEDCDDGSDEAGCPEVQVFVCDNGDEIPEDFECDGDADCNDGSDEVGCPVFVCDDSEEIPADLECDGYEDCVDGSDEVGCPDYAELKCN